MADLEGRTIIVSGVGPGLGRETALVAAREGAAVVLGARTAATLESVAAEIDPTGARVAHAVTDITDPSACTRLVQTATERFGRVDALVNCAALDAVFGGLEGAGDFAEWRAAFEVNVLGSLQMTRAALPELARQGGGVVFVSSQTQHHPPPLALQAAYAASKAGLTGAMRHVAQEVGARGVRLNEVAPGWMWGPPVEGYMSYLAQQRGVSQDVVVSELTANMPLRRMATDEEVAEAVVFLASPRAGGITGQTLFVNAGEVMR
jgi:NAD(P)-dependent dehydrogenase (short-subunit alcohol dehydrogenase family)